MGQVVAIKYVLKSRWSVFGFFKKSGLGSIPAPLIHAEKENLHMENKMEISNISKWNRIKNESIYLLKAKTKMI